MVSDKLWMGEERDGSGGQTLEGEGCGTSGLGLERHMGEDSNGQRKSQGWW